MEALTKILLGFCLIGLCILGSYFYYVIWFVPERVRRKLLMQGICGPKPTFPYGNISEMKWLTVMEKNKRDAEARSGEVIKHDYRSAVFPYYERWRKEYGMCINLYYI
jgi:gibberellin 13-oxidase